MAEKKEKGNIEETNSPKHYLTPDSQKVRLRAKESLEKAKQVLADSGNQLMKNKSSDGQTPVQETLVNKKNEKEDSNEHA